MGLEALDGRAARQLVTLLTERDFGALVASGVTLRGLFGDPSVARWRSRRCTSEGAAAPPPPKPASDGPDCDADFAPATNGPTACSYHPAGLFELEDVTGMEIFYVCCDANYVTLYSLIGARSESDNEADAKGLRDLRAVPGCVTSAHEVCRPITGEIPDGPIQAYSPEHGEWIDATAHEDGPDTFIMTPLDGSDSAVCAKHIPYRHGAGRTPYPLFLRHPPVAD